MEREITERISAVYTAQEREIMGLEKRIIESQIKIHELDTSSIIYPTQKSCAGTIVAQLVDREIICVMVVAQTQSGKTGVIVSTINQFIDKNDIPLKNIYIITGLSSREWVEQTKVRVPEALKINIIHRNQLTDEFTKQIRSKKNVLIFIDEIQIAAKETQSLHRTFHEAGFYNKTRLLQNDIKIIEFSATPNGTIYDLMGWGDNASKVRMKPGPDYTSCFALKNAGRVYQYKDLCGYDKRTGKICQETISHITNLKKMIREKYSEYPRYHIIRSPNGVRGDKVIINFENVFGKNISVIKYNQQSDVEDINDILKCRPEHDTFIFIKEKLRCSKTLDKTYIGLMIERYTKSPDDSVVIQGLIGRGTGYDDNGESIYYTNLSSIDRYEKLWNSNFEDKEIKWKSNTTKKSSKGIHSTGTYNNASLIDGMSVKTEISKDDVVIQKFKTQIEAKEFYYKNLKGHFKGHGPRKRKPDSSGFFQTTIRREKRVHSWDEVYSTRKWSLNKTHHFTFHPCYEDKNDKSTLEFWLMYKKFEEEDETRQVISTAVQ